jgi:hypothetical protein
VRPSLKLSEELKQQDETIKSERASQAASLGSELERAKLFVQKGECPPELLHSFQQQLAGGFDVNKLHQFVQYRTGELFEAEEKKNKQETTWMDTHCCWMSKLSFSALQIDHYSHTEFVSISVMV